VDKTESKEEIGMTWNGILKRDSFGCKSFPDQSKDTNDWQEKSISKNR
jgi:hypothetical protein